MPPRRVYPPSHHVLRHLRLVHRWTDDALEVTMPVLPDLLTGDLGASGRALRLGAIATLVDSAAGIFSVRQVTPDWVATLSLGTSVLRPATGTEVVARCAPIRVGRNNVTTATTVHDDDGLVARSVCTYARLPGRDDNPTASGVHESIVDYREDDEEPRVDLHAYLRLRPRADAPVVDLDLHDRIRNSFGSIQGGVVVMLAEAAAEHAVGRRWGRPCVAVDAQVTYLAQARGGPFEVAADVLRDDGASATVSVEIRDVGPEGRLLDVATVTIADPTLALADT